MSKKTILHVKQSVIRSNQKTGAREPPLIVRQGQAVRYGSRVVGYNPDGSVAFVLLYEPDHPLSCGARVWLESYNRVEVLDEQV